MQMRILTPYVHHTGKLSRPVTLAVVSDLHDEPYEDLFPMLAGADALLVPGDVSNRYHQSASEGVQFLKEAAVRLPTFFSVGNHETRQKEYRALINAIGQTGAQVLINKYVRFGELWIGGWYDPEIVREPDMMDDFEKLPGVKVLMCHKPEHYIRRLRDRNVDLVVPGQGLFPKYTRGVVDGRMIVSAGVSNPVHMPRWGNPCEVLRITLD